METEAKKTKARHFTLPAIKRINLLRYAIVFAMTGTGVAFMMGGFMAWVIGEHALLFVGFLSGVIFVSAGGLGLLRCLEGNS